MKLKENMEELLRDMLSRRPAQENLNIGDMLELELLECDVPNGVFLLHGSTRPWMCNIEGTLHGGISATLVDQAMGLVAFCAKHGDGFAPTVDLQVSYHRPLIPGLPVLIRVRVVSVSRNLIRLSAEAAMEQEPQRICLSSSATFFYKPAAAADDHS